MRPVTVTVAGTGTSSLIPMDYVQAPFNASIAAVISATATYNVEYTLDNVQSAAVTPTWFQSSITAATTNQSGNIAFPVRAVRLNVTASTGSVTLTVIQGRRGS